MKKVFLASLGCPKNQVDAELMLGALAGDGWEMTLDPDEADVHLVNTCSFIDAAKEESIETILELAASKGDRAGRKLVVTGCLAERYGNDLRSEMPEVDAFVGTGDTLRLLEVLRDLDMEGRDGPLVYAGAQHVLPNARLPRTLTASYWSAYLKVSEGCDHDCAFCIIPKIRGPHESRDADDVVEEARALVDQGVREVNLIAQDLTAWGRDLPGKLRLSDLLRRLGEVEGLDWVRLLYCYPNFVTDDLLDAMDDVPNVCRYMDVPLQHASDRMLKAMRRGHTGASLRRLLEKIRARVPGIAIRTSFIVGFPGETEADFEELCRFVEESEFERVGVFRYSREENTLAGTMSGQIGADVKEDRWNRLMAIQRPISRRRNESRVGKTVPVLLCGTDEDGRPMARTADQAPDIDGIVVLDEETAPGEIVPARIVGADDYDLFGVRSP